MKRKIAALCCGLLLASACALAERIALDVPLYLQKDSRWRDVFLNVDGNGKERTIGQAGCTLCCLSSVESQRTGESITPFDMLFRVDFSGDELHWPKGYERLARAKKGMLVRQAAPILLACLESGRPALVGLYSPERGTHWVVVYGFDGPDPTDAQTAHFLIRDPGTKDRTTLNQVKEYFPQIRVIRTYGITDELRAVAEAALAAE